MSPPAMEHSWLENPHAFPACYIIKSETYRFVLVPLLGQNLYLSLRKVSGSDFKKVPLYHLWKGWWINGQRCKVRVSKKNPTYPWNIPQTLDFLGYVPGFRWNFLIVSVSLHRQKTTQVPRFGAMKCLYALARGPELMEDFCSKWVSG